MTRKIESWGREMERVRTRWPVYAAEAVLLGLFMVSAAAFGTLLEYPSSPVRLHIADGDVRRVLMGVAMCGTLIALVYSPLGGRSGAHMNPAVTLAFYRLGKVGGADAAHYIVAHFVGGLAGLELAAVLLGPALAVPPVHYVATVPGPWGTVAAFAAEVAISFTQLAFVLRASNDQRWTRWTGLGAGVLLALYIAVESPVSGTSLNPARSLGSAWPAHEMQSLWIYFLAPAIGMLLAAEGYARLYGLRQVYCAKLHHPEGVPCPFHCRYHELSSRIRRSHVLQHAL